MLYIESWGFTYLNVSVIVSVLIEITSIGISIYLQSESVILRESGK